MIRINGTYIEQITQKTVAEYLLENGYDIRRVAVERNGDILPRPQYESTVLEDGDCLEIVSFVGGG